MEYLLNDLKINQMYYVKEYEPIHNKENYSQYRAKYLGIQKGINKFIVLTKINIIGEKWIRDYVSVIPIDKIKKMESLKDITNEMLPNEILIKIDNYL
jgi:hypothetical protein